MFLFRPFFCLGQFKLCTALPNRSLVAANTTDTRAVYPTTASLAINNYLITDSIEVTVEKYLTYAINSENELPVAVKCIILFDAKDRKVPYEARSRYSIFFYASTQQRDFLLYMNKELGVFCD